MALFTAETAKIAAAKSWSSESARFAPPQEPAKTALVPLVAEKPADDYAAQTLSRVRAQLDLVNAALTRALNADEFDRDSSQAVDRLSAAQARLSEQERILAGRPLPGSFRPMQERGGRKAGRAVEVWTEPPSTPPVASSVPATGLPGPSGTPPVQEPNG